MAKRKEPSERTEALMPSLSLEKTLSIYKYRLSKEDVARIYKALGIPHVSDKAKEDEDA